MVRDRHNALPRFLKISLISCLAIVMAAVFALRPMSVNFLKYLAWSAVNAPAPESGYIEYRGARIHYAVYGSGQPVLLLHGGLADKLSWFSQLPWLAEAGRRVVLIDTRGHGASTHGGETLGYRLFAADALQVLDKLAIKRTDIVGFSDGGITALLLGLEAPERVGRIVAISANFHPSGLLNGSPDMDVGWFHQYRQDLFNWLRGFWSAPNEQNSDLAEELDLLWKTEPRLTHDDLRAITAPALVITGENDIIDLAHSGELAQILPHGRIEVILGAGHAAPITHARQVNALIGGFLGIGLD